MQLCLFLAGWPSPCLSYVCVTEASICACVYLSVCVRKCRKGRCRAVTWDSRLHTKAADWASLFGGDRRHVNGNVQRVTVDCGARSTRSWLTRGRHGVKSSGLLASVPRVRWLVIGNAQTRNTSGDWGKICERPLIYPHGSSKIPKKNWGNAWPLWLSSMESAFCLLILPFRQRPETRINLSIEDAVRVSRFESGSSRLTPRCWTWSRVEVPCEMS